MAVELAIVTPIILLVLVIAIDALVFMGECARFDQLAPQHILACAVSPAKDEYEADARLSAIQKRLDEDFSKRGSSVSIACSDAGVPLASMTVYTCTLHFVPWPLNAAGAPPTLDHSCTLAIDPYTPGELI